MSEDEKRIINVLELISKTPVKTKASVLII